MITLHVRSHRVVLGVFFLSFFALACLYVPRLTNCLWTDVEFTGWVSPIAQRMVLGEQIYRDFTLPIPPGSFLVMAAVQKLTGRFLLLDELWLCAVSNFGMMGIAYAMCRLFTNGRNATLATILTGPVIILTPKEIAYDQTAELIAWGAVALFARGLTRESTRSRAWWLRGAGFAAALTLAFKSSTGMGAVGGVLLGLGLLAAIAWRNKQRAALSALARDAAAALTGAAAGLIAVGLIVIVAGGSLGEFYQVVFVDGPNLKGGRMRMILNLLSYAVFQTPVHYSLIVVVFSSWILVRLVGNKEALLIDEARSAEDEATSSRFVVGVSAFVLIVLGLGIAMLGLNAGTVPNVLRATANFAAIPPILGLTILAVFLVSHTAGAADPKNRRAAFAATALCAAAVSLMHNLSHPQHRPFYDNNPIIPLSFLALFVVLDHARIPKAKYALFGLGMLGLFGDKFQRYLDARYPVDDPYFWNGLKVSNNGLHILHAAQRARELAGPSGTVLMLPEDPATEALIGRPRPKLRGAIVFVDQYPDHVLKEDQATLQAAPPQVLVLYPHDYSWTRVYRVWTLKSAASRLHVDFVEEYKDRLYQSDSTYPTWFLTGPGTLEIFVKKPPESQPQEQGNAEPKAE